MKLVDAEKLKALLEYGFHCIGEEVIALVIVDRDGLVIASKIKKNLNPRVLGGLAALVEPVLKRISLELEFDLGRFGAGTFDTKQHRLIFCEAGPDLIVVILANAMAIIDNIFPYAYLIAEKAARIIDNRPVSPIIPLISQEDKTLQGSENVQRLLIENGNYVTKSVILGDGGVGKTTLVTQFVHRKFEDDYKSTIGAQIMKKSVYFQQWDANVKMTIFDMAGQNQFARVRQSYYAGAQTGFIVYDVTRPETFENIQNWYNACTAIVPNITLILIANKIDLKDDRRITVQEGSKKALDLGIGYLETSALYRDIVDEAFHTLAFLFLLSFKDSEKLSI